MKYLLPIFTVFILFGSALAMASLPSYGDWRFTYNADSASFSFQNSTALVTVVNGIAYLKTNLSEPIEKGSRITLNLSVQASTMSIDQGIKIILGGDVLLDSKLKNGKQSFQFYALCTYNASDTLTLILYDFGGKLSVKLQPFYIEKVKGGLNEGLLLTGVGITVVFVVLSILASVMYLLKPKNKEEKKKLKEVKKMMTIKEQEVDSEVIAAIVGALNLYLGGKKFKIINVKPSLWKYYGRLKMMRRWK